MKSVSVIAQVFAFLLISLYSSLASGEQTAISPRQEVENTINELVRIVEAYPGDDKLKERRDKLREAITPRFDFREMAKRSLGAHWKERNETEREDFVRLFSDLLAKTYLDRIENVRSNMVKVKGENVSSHSALVKTMVNYKDDVFPIDYRLLQTETGWKVYDVLIENIGLVTNYRTEFAGIIRKEQFAGLMKRLREKTAAKA